MPLIERRKENSAVSLADDAYSLLSIGAACRTRYQIDRFMEKVAPSYTPTSYFFDWLFGGGLKGVTNLLERDLTITPDDIAVVGREGGFLPHDKASGMAFFHDFGTPAKHWATEEECRNALASNMEQSISKYAHLSAKTRSLLSERNVALVYLPSQDEYASLATVAPNLLDLLKRKFGRNYLFVNVIEDNKHEPVSRAGIVNIQVKDKESPKTGTPGWWEGWDESWAAGFSSAFVYRE